MSSTRRGTDERNSREKGDKSRPKPALRPTHAGNGMKKKKKGEDPAFSQRAPLERSPALTVTWSDVWKGLLHLSDG